MTVPGFRSPTKLIIFLLMIEEGVFETVRCPRYCTCYLNLTDYTRSVACKAKRLDNIDLSVPKRVQTLDLSNNSISALDDRGFQSLGLLELVNLYLKHNSIRSIGLHSFIGLVYLKKVDLSGNNLYQILPWTFHDNNNLKFISLSGNPLGHITHSGPFLDVPSLEVLELNNCHFGYFPEDAFSALPNLRRLDISFNQIISFDINTVQFLHNLKELDISKNPWSCNANMRSLRDFLESKSGELKGYLCDLSLKEEINLVKPEMFERIIAVGNDYSEYEVFGNLNKGERSDENEDSSSSEEVGKKEEEEVKCECKQEDKGALFSVKNFILPPIWLMFVSFQFGVCATLFSGYCCIYCCHKRKKYQHLEALPPMTPNSISTDLQQPIEDFFENEQDQSMQSSMETITCPDTPPPSYRDLFVT